MEKHITLSYELKGEGIDCAKKVKAFYRDEKEIKNLIDVGMNNLKRHAFLGYVKQKVIGE